MIKKGLYHNMIHYISNQRSIYHNFQELCHSVDINYKDDYEIFILVYENIYNGGTAGAFLGDSRCEGAASRS